MSLPELLLRCAAYLSSILSLALAAWAAAEVLLPARARFGQRLLAVVAGQFVLCAICVQTLGLLGWLHAPEYLAASLTPGLAAAWFWRTRQPVARFVRLLRSALRLFVLAPRLGLGLAALAGVLALGIRHFSLPHGIDSMTTHGPLVVGWIQAGRVTLESHWNYPQFWEYQFVPGFLLVGSDTLAVIPGLMVIVGLLLVVRELAFTLGVSGNAGLLLSLLCVTLPVVWRDPMKGDPVLAFAVLLGILAIERCCCGSSRGAWLLQLAVCLLLGTKATGLLYGVLLFGCWAGLHLAAGVPPLRTRVGLGWLVATLALQGSAAAVQVNALWAHANPVYPLRFQVAGVLLADGPVDTAGTALLDRAADLETWRLLWSGGSQSVGPEWGALPLVLGLAWLDSTFCVLQRPRRRRAAQRARWAIHLVAALLWLLYAVTPWTCSLDAGPCAMLANGSSLRFALAPLLLSYLLVVALAQRWLGPRLARALLALSMVLTIFKWGPEPSAILVATAAAAALVQGRWPRPRARRFPLALAARASCGGLLVLACAAGQVRWVERTREATWLPNQQAIWTRVWREGPRRVRIGVNNDWAQYRYMLFGPRFENTLEPVPMGPKSRTRAVGAGIDYVYAACQKQADCAAAVTLMLQRGWLAVARSADRRQVLFAPLAGSAPRRPDPEGQARR